MRRPLLLAVLLASTALLAAGKIELPPPESGVIDGKVALLVWPAIYETPTSHTLQPKERCVVHFVAATAPDQEKTAPCGEWFQPAVGMHRLWVEGPGYISPEPIVMRYGADPFTGRGMTAIAPIVPSGFVALEPGMVLGSEQGLRILSLSPSDSRPWLRAFDRRVRDPKNPSPMPAGKILAGVFDRTTGDAIALTRPVDLAAGKTAVVAPKPPREHSDVLVILRRPLRPQRDRLTLTLKDDRGSRAPDVFLHAVDTVFAVWSGARGRSATVTVDADTLTAKPIVLQLRPQRVATFRGDLQRKPQLKISVTAPADFSDPIETRVATVDGSEPVRTSAVRAGEPVVLPVAAARLRVSLVTGRWMTEQEVDLSDGKDGEVEFRLAPIVLTGRLYSREDPVPGRITFLDGDRELLTTETNAEDSYRAVFWLPGLYVASIDVRNDDAEPFLDPAVAVEHDRTVDFHLPANHVAVTVRDARTGQPIPQANVGVYSLARHDTVGEMSLGHRYTTDEKGRTVLPRLRTGSVRLEAWAPAYARSRAETFDIDDGAEKEIAFDLEPLDTVVVRVELADGSAGVNAEAAAFDPAGALVWRGEASNDGTLRIPVAMRSHTILVRHPRAASTLLPGGAEMLRLAMPPMPLVTVTTTDAAGVPVPFASLTLWIGGVRLTGGAAAFATWSIAAATDNRASWAGRNLVPGPLQILATRGVTPAELASGSYDALATTFASPAPSLALVVAR